ncbi:MAG: A/G-specific adenine glycosylase [Thermodesulfobacteriota bacterium]
MDWYRNSYRDLPWRKRRDPYAIWISEVMLQQTQVKTVLRYYSKFLNAFPDVWSLSQAKSQAVLKVWEGLGYYARARNLHAAAKQVMEEHSGKIPSDRNGFSRLPGVGKYISAAVLSIAFNHPLAVVDGNVKRVLSRLFRINTPVNSGSCASVFEHHATRLLDEGNPGIFNQAVMELGALICKPKKPDCAKCPLIRCCRAFNDRKTADYPKRIVKQRIPVYSVVFGIIVKDRKFLITRRRPDGFLGGLWEFPGGKILENESPQAACLREVKEEVDLEVKIERNLARIRHAYTHFKIEADVFICRYLSGRVKRRSAEDHRWIALNKIDEYPFPGANRKFIPMLKSVLSES